ncbi:MAG: amino acid--tRNA ligase-related protein [bacterium]
MPYFDQTAYLSQSGQLYMEAAAMAFARYRFGPTFRAEKSKTRRHLGPSSGWSSRMAFLDLDGDMDLAEDFLCFIVQRVVERRRTELEILGRDVSVLVKVQKPFPASASPTRCHDPGGGRRDRRSRRLRRRARDGAQQAVRSAHPRAPLPCRR